MGNLFIYVYVIFLMIGKKKEKNIESVLVIYSKKSFESDVFCRVRNILKKNKIKFSSVFIDDFKDSNFKNFDLILVVGGDGTFIRVSHFLEDELILGVNSDMNTSEGGLLELNEKNLQKLNSILLGKFYVFERRRVDVYLNNDLLFGRALNEVYFGAKNQFHTSRYDLILEGRKEEQRSSGVLVVTCTGSRAWYKSAGGRSFSRRGLLKYLVREPFVSRVFSSKMLKGKIKKEIGFVSKMYHDAVVSMDSNLIVPVGYLDKVKMKLSSKNLRCVRI